MQSVSPLHSPVHHTLTLIPLILPISVMSAKQTHMVKGLMLHSGHIGITVRKLLYFFSQCHLLPLILTPPLIEKLFSFKFQIRSLYVPSPVYYMNATL